MLAVAAVSDKKFAIPSIRIESVVRCFDGEATGYKVAFLWEDFDREGYEASIRKDADRHKEENRIRAKRGERYVFHTEWETDRWMLNEVARQVLESNAWQEFYSDNPVLNRLGIELIPFIAVDTPLPTDNRAEVERDCRWTGSRGFLIVQIPPPGGRRVARKVPVPR